MVNGSDHTEHHRNDFGQLYRSGNQFERVPECTVSSDSCNCKSFTGDTNHNSLRTDDLLFRRECHTDIQFRYRLLMVNGSHHTEHKCNCIRKLHRKSDQFQRMPESAISSNSSNCKCLTRNPNNNTLRPYNILRWRECNTDIQFRNRLFMVNRSNNTEYKCNCNR